MAKYKVSFTKIESYEVEADSATEAEDIAIDYLMNDKMAFTDDKIDEIDVEEVG